MTRISNSRSLHLLLVLLAASTAACDAADGPGAPDGATGAARGGDAGGGGDVWDGATPGAGDDAGPLECLGSFQPTWGVIDPDAPVFSDEYDSQEDVERMFADARAGDTDAYRAYRAAKAIPDLLECAFCACGCASSIGHLSALDCFKDLHGFG